jgi:hypothetical protein
MSNMSETTIQVAGKQVTIWQRSPAVPVEKWDVTRYKHRFIVRVRGKHRMFAFYGSVLDFQNRRAMLEKGELEEAFRRVVCDGLAMIEGDATPDQMRTRERLDELGFSDDDIRAACEELGDR